MSDYLGAGASAPALILGFAECLFDDLDRAQRLYPAAVRFGVNRAAKEIRCHHLVSLDRHRIPDFLPDYQITVHAGRFGGIRDDHPPLDHIDCYWPHLQPGGTSGSSGWLAAKIAVKLGHFPVVMCGCPIDGQDHVTPDPKHDTCTWANPKQVSSARAIIEQEILYHPFVFSMSGWTRDLLGEPC